jgi:hypothetical protein
VQPLSNAAGGTRLTLSTVSAATTNNVAAGYYVVRLYTTGAVCWISWANSVTLPTSGADPAANTYAVGDGEMVQAPGSTKLAAILTGSGTTGELALTAIA